MTLNSVQSQFLIYFPIVLKLDELTLAQDCWQRPLVRFPTALTQNKHTETLLFAILLANSLNYF